MQTRDIILDKKKAVGMEIPLPNANLIMAIGEKGYIMCGYLNLETAEKFEDAAAVVTGVKNIDDLLEAKIIAVTSQAGKRGVKVGMKGKIALAKLS